MKNWPLCFILLFLLFDLTAQSDTLELSEAVVVNQRLQNFGLGQRVLTFSAVQMSEGKGRHLGDFLTEQSSVLIQSYGSGSLASPSLRGTGFGHTAVLWNGFNLQSPLNGGIDFSLLNADVADELSIQYGGSGALFGSGAIGGVIHLNQQSVFDQGWKGEVRLGLGSFGRFQQGGNLSWSGKKWSSDLRLFRESADNDFIYERFGQQRRQSNNARTQLGLVQHNRWQLKDNQFLNTWIWTQQTNRQIPPSITEAESDAVQQDTTFRFAAEWQRVGERSVQKIRAAWIDERFLYYSSLIDSSHTQSKMFIAEAETKLSSGNNQIFFIGGHYTYEKGSAPGIYQDRPFRHRPAVFFSYKHLFGKWTGVINFRQEVVPGQNLWPTTASIGIQGEIDERWILQSQLSSNYKVPTFNDLYWSDIGAQGNEDLLPERSLGHDLSVDYKTGAYQFQTTVYNLLVKDWILWRPENAALWRPENLRKVWSRGLEVTVAGNWNIDKMMIKGKLSYHWNKATNVEEIPGSGDLLGKQLIYIPEHSGRAEVVLRWKAVRWVYRHNLVGLRFTSTDNSSQLAGYHVGNTHISVQWKLGRLKCFSQLRVENMWSEDYEVLAFRPMPGRGIFLELRLGF